MLVAVTGERLAGPRGGSSVPKMGLFRGADNRLEPGGIRSRTGGQLPVWNCLRASAGRSGATGGLPVPVTAAAGRPGSSRRDREEHPPLAAAAGQLSEQRPRKPQGIGRRRLRLVRGWGLQGCSPFPAPPPVGTWARGRGPCGIGCAPPSPSSPLPWRARETQLGTGSPPGSGLARRLLFAAGPGTRNQVEPGPAELSAGLHPRTGP